MDIAVRAACDVDLQATLNNTSVHKESTSVYTTPYLRAELSQMCFQFWVAKSAAIFASDWMQFSIFNAKNRFQFLAPKQVPVFGTETGSSFCNRNSVSFLASKQVPVLGTETGSNFWHRNRFQFLAPKQVPVLGTETGSSF